VTVDVDRDTTDNQRYPRNAYQWGLIRTAYLASLPAPTNCNGLQDAGNQTDSIGTSTLTAANTPGTQQVVAGTARLCVTMANATGQAFRDTAYGNAATDDILSLSNATITSATTGAGAQVIVHGGNNASSVTTGDTINELKARYRQGGNVQEGANTLVVGTWSPWLLWRNSDSLAGVPAPRVRLFTNTEKISATFAAGAGTVYAIGCSAGTTSGPLAHNYNARWLGVTVQQFTEAMIKSMLLTLNWPAPWTAA
jgi:hypothetical protein